MRKELGALRARYGDGLDTRSHGEAFLHFFAERLVPGGIYFLDEPEAPLSPSRQLAFLSLLDGHGRVRLPGGHGHPLADPAGLSGRATC